MFAGCCCVAAALAPGVRGGEVEERNKCGGWEEGGWMGVVRGLGLGDRGLGGRKEGAVRIAACASPPLRHLSGLLRGPPSLPSSHHSLPPEPPTPILAAGPPG